jgi:hypothetical protein
MALFKKKPPGDPDAQLLAVMVSRGAVLTNRRNVRHYLYGRDEDAAAPAAAALVREGYSVDSRPAATGGNWLLLAEKEEVVNAASVAAARKLFEGLANTMTGGDYDGWEAAIVEKA